MNASSQGEEPVCEEELMLDTRLNCYLASENISSKF